MHAAWAAGKGIKNLLCHWHVTYLSHSSSGAACSKVQQLQQQRKQMTPLPCCSSRRPTAWWQPTGQAQSHVQQVIGTAMWQSAARPSQASTGASASPAVCWCRRCRVAACDVLPGCTEPMARVRTVPDWTRPVRAIASPGYVDLCTACFHPAAGIDQVCAVLWQEQRAAAIMPVCQTMPPAVTCRVAY